MKTKAILIALVLSLGVFAACTDKKKTEDNAEIEVISEETKEVKEVVEETMDKDEKRRLDSIQQVKEHGHAH